MKEHHPLSNQNTIVFGNLQEAESISHPSQKHTAQNQKQNDLIFYRKKDNKQKKLTKKPDTIMQKFSMMTPQTYSHVYNFLNIMSINEQTLKDPQSSQSYFKSIFYTKNIEKVQLRKNAIILFSRNIESTLTPVQYLIKRFRSFGDNTFHELANAIQSTNQFYQSTNYMPDLMESYDGQPISRFIEAMQQKAYICKVAPNKIVISRKLLQLLGEDMEFYGLKLCKYKTPFRQISSGESYYRVIKKSIENIGHISEFLKEKMTFEQLQSKTCMQFNEYLYTKQQKKIYCRFKLYMPTPLINCVELIEQISELEDCDRSMKVDSLQKRAIDRECNEQKYLEAQTLKHLIQISDSMLINNRKRLAGYIVKQI